LLFVFDTNVIISASLKPNSLPAEALHHAQNIGRLVFSTDTSIELESVLRRPHLTKYLKLPIESIIEAVNQKAYIVEKLSNAVIQCRDEKDVKFLRLAYTIKEDCIISGDLDLIVLHPFENIPIYNPADFLNNF